MIAVYALIYVPILLFVLGFLYETFISFKRLRGKASHAYVDATWEVTHTFLVFGLVMLLMLYTQAIDQLADVLFLPAFLAAIALGARGACYIYIFYVRKGKKITWVDHIFAWSHVAAALLLVTAVLRFSWYLISENPPANEQFVTPFLVGLVFIFGLCVLPLLKIYSSR